MLAETFQSEKPPEAGGASAASLPVVLDAPRQPGPLQNLKTGAPGLCATVSMSPVDTASKARLQVEQPNVSQQWHSFLKISHTAAFAVVCPACFDLMRDGDRGHALMGWEDPEG
jgi:hypothetical protein